MTRKEAIRLLKTYRNCLFGILTEPIDMAIKALERQDKLQRALDMEKGAYNALVKNIQCEDAISRQAVLETLDNMDNALDEDRTIENYKELLKECYEILPLVNPQEPKTGHWINVNNGKWNTIPAYKCSVCGENADLRDWSGESPFCPWCGAKMESEE